MPTSTWHTTVPRTCPTDSPAGRTGLPPPNVMQAADDPELGSGSLAKYIRHAAAVGFFHGTNLTSQHTPKPTTKHVGSGHVPPRLM